MTTPSNSAPIRGILGLGLAAAIGGICLCLVVVAGGLGVYFYLQQTPIVDDPAVIYILDASPRMTQLLEDGTRLTVAQAVLAEVVRPADTSVKAGLRTFGTGAVAAGCEDTDLLVPLAPGTQSQIADTAFGLKAGSALDSALAAAMLAAIKDLAAAKGPHTLVVITGGADSCNVDAGLLIRQEADRAGINLQEFVIGLKVTADEALAIKGILEATGGTYLDAPDTDTLSSILQDIQAFIERPSPALLTTLQTVVTTAEPPADGGYQPQTACDNAYQPYRTGAVWTSSTSFGEVVWAVESVVGDLTQAVLTTNATSNGFTYVYTAECTSAGVGISALNSYTWEGTQYQIVVSNQSGVELLPADQLTPGATWNNSYNQEISWVDNGSTLTSTLDISQAYTVGDTQTLTTTLGAFDVIPVTLRKTEINSYSSGGVYTTNCTTVIYYAYSIGALRTEQNCDNLSYYWDLQSYHLP